MRRHHRSYSRRSWAARAHIPALRSMANDFELVGVANSSFESSKSAASVLGIPKAFQNAAELASSPDIDIVTVTVRVPHHLALVTTALEAGKHVFCEWPLGNGLGEAETLAALAKEKNVLGVAGTQARMAPEFAYLHQLLDEGYLGEVLSSNLVAIGGGWARPLRTPQPERTCWMKRMARPCSPFPWATPSPPCGTSLAILWPPRFRLLRGREP